VEIVDQKKAEEVAPEDNVKDSWDADSSDDEEGWSSSVLSSH